jgi:hypothetical protein
MPTHRVDSGAARADLQVANGLNAAEEVVPLLLAKQLPEPKTAGLGR